MAADVTEAVERDELALALAASVQDAFEQLVLAHQDRLYRFTLRLTNCPADAEEATQDAFVRAYRALERYPAERVAALQLKPWLYQIALNVVRNRARTRRAAPVSLSAGLERGDVHEPEANGEEGPEQRLTAREQQQEMAAFLAALPTRYRTALVLRYVEDLSYAEAAAILGQPVGTVKANVHRGVQRLRARLDEMTQWRDDVPVAPPAKRSAARHED